MTVDLSLHTKLLSLGKSHQKGRLALARPCRGVPLLKVSKIPYIWTLCLKQTNPQVFNLVAAVL